ncbi:helix-turn-helix domain-containing protein [Vagococcus acidifermentans]|uniref:Insertion element IS150 protein InsJ-like helix-turn-helix domain-containing protein n=1 Tax=Vagococcus acidifermentans TaxID=564710 RepID=A0A430ALE3_9ENTE|nr:helix-turn-helix domain-containing protein [Vagococcus acidifermentans]RSU08941.1 hypothetical protein CBF27_13865 [Vagococcus acidifermentans]
MSSKRASKKVTFQERIEIVEFTIAHELDYQAAIKKYEVSYQQVYNWVKKYEKFGIDSLQDRRGHNKSKEELSEIDKLKLENKQLKARNLYLEMEKDLEKKLQELNRRNKTFP